MTDSHSGGIIERFRPHMMHILAGGLGGLAADALTHPIDTIRARLQFDRGVGSAARYKTTYGTARSIIGGEGFLALYRGFGSVAIFTVPAHALYFGGYEIAKQSLSHSPDDPLAHFASGVFADACGAILWCPQDVVKQRLQVQEDRSRYRGSWQTLKHIYRDEGLRGLYRGTVAAFLVYGPMVGLHFMIYERLKKLMGSPGAFEVLTAALISASTAALVTTPLDVLKTRLQAQSIRDGGYRSISHAFTSMWHNEGALSFFKGAFARALWLGPNVALSMMFYEEFKLGLAKILKEAPLQPMKIELE